MACGIYVKNVMAGPENESQFTILDNDTMIEIGDKGPKMIKKAYDLGYLYEEKHRGCARCIVAALQDAVDFLPSDKDLFRTASCLDGGATPTKLANCGAFTGAGMVIGWMCGTQRFGDNILSHKLIHQVHNHFEEEYGSVICKQVRANAESRCPEVVANAAKWTAAVLLKQFTNYQDI
jgi:C_GCAxxG_C_C family probable redox protein